MNYRLVIRKHLVPFFGDMRLVALLIFTGIRRGEALGLQWEDIDFDRKLINIRRSVRFVGNKGYIGPTKSKAGVRLIPLEPQLEDILMVLPPDSKYILGNGEFPITEMTYKRGWERICRTIDMHGATAHVLRHIYHDGGDPPGHQYSADHCRALGHQHHYEQVCPRTRG
jgi:integrase